jgi:fructose-specific phosphotransferase system component IIB
MQEISGQFVIFLDKKNVEGSTFFKKKPIMNINISNAYSQVFSK